MSHFVSDGIFAGRYLYGCVLMQLYIMPLGHAILFYAPGCDAKVNVVVHACTFGYRSCMYKLMFDINEQQVFLSPLPCRVLFSCLSVVYRPGTVFMRNSRDYFQRKRKNPSFLLALTSFLLHQLSSARR